MLTSASSQSLSTLSSSPARRASWSSSTCSASCHSSSTKYRATIMVSAAPPSYSSALQTIATLGPNESRAETTQKSPVRVFFSIPGSMAPVADMGEHFDESANDHEDVDSEVPSDGPAMFDVGDRESEFDEDSDFDDWLSEDDHTTSESDIAGSLDSVPRGRSRHIPSSRPITSDLAGSLDSLRRGSCQRVPNSSALRLPKDIFHSPVNRHTPIR